MFGLFKRKHNHDGSHCWMETIQHKVHGETDIFIRINYEIKHNHNYEDHTNNNRTEHAQFYIDEIRGKIGKMIVEEMQK